MQKAVIQSLSHDGRGIAQINGKTIFIVGALPGETVSFTYSRKHKKYDEGKLITVEISSADRVTPECQHFSICGGCSLQHLKSNAQIVFKQHVLLEHLQHIGGIKPQKILAPLVGPVWQYRHKARLGVKFVRKKNKVLVGFREKSSNFITDIQQCSVLHPAVGRKITDLAQLIQSLKTYAQIPQIEVAIGAEKIALVFRHLQLLPESDLELLRQFAKLHQFHIYLQAGGTESVKLLWPEADDSFLNYQLHQVMPAKADIQKINNNDSSVITLQFYPTDFTQINPYLNQQMVMRAVELLNPKKQDRILDLFCGLGNFSIPLAKFSEHVIGIEGDAIMVQRARQNALTNQVKAEFYAANLTENLSQCSWAKQKYDKILLDPPRNGAREIIEYMPNFAARKILYISCNTATLARDAALLVKQGYKLCEAGVMDMFPHTSHVEAMALFEKT